MGDWESVKAENLVRHKSGIYYLRAKIGGKIIRKSLGSRSLRIAEMKRDSLMPELRLRADAIKQKEQWTRNEALTYTRTYYAGRRAISLSPSRWSTVSSCWPA